MAMHTCHVWHPNNCKQYSAYKAKNTLRNSCFLSPLPSIVTLALRWWVVRGCCLFSSSPSYNSLPSFFLPHSLSSIFHLPPSNIPSTQSVWFNLKFPLFDLSVVFTLAFFISVTWICQISLFSLRAPCVFIPFVFHLFCYRFPIR